MYTHIMIRFGELNTKGKNKKDFINQLNRNIKTAMKQFKTLEVNKTHDRIYLVLNQEDGNEVCDVLANISGIQNYSKVIKVEKDLEMITSSALEMIKDVQFESFRVKTKRADKLFPLHSDDINRHIAGLVLKSHSVHVNLQNPDLSIYVEIRQEGAYLYRDIIKGLGGFPLGVQGKSLLLMSGGIDSPVAGYMMMKRGIKIEAIHFASPPYTSDLALQKVKDLLKVLAKIQGDIKLIVIPFTKLQVAINDLNYESYNITLMRRMMYRIAEKVLKNGRCLALCSGESVGQVASQTLESIATINEVITTPMIRPLATYDKNDIIDLAKKIGTYDISIRPGIDCCTIFTPIKPATKPTSKLAQRYEEMFDFASLIDECVENAEIFYVNADEEKEEIEEFL